ncbi:MAG: rhombotarget lipoprotein [Pseudomonadota bacterium]
MTQLRTAIAPLALCAALGLSGCTTWLTGSPELRRTGSSSSLVEYLYPDGEIPPPAPDVLPALELPLRVGIGFVPERGLSPLKPADKHALLEDVADAFRARPYVSSIEAIPDQYLAGTSGVTGLRQLASLLGVDVVALVSYDQLTLTGERESALLYWTIVGTAVVKGNTSEVQTMIDTAVFDPTTATLLFRAPGSHSQQRNATLFKAAHENAALRSESLAAANTEMIANLDAELGRFEQRVKDGEAARVEWRSGYGGGGAAGPALLLGLCLTLLAAQRERRANAQSA